LGPASPDLSRQAQLSDLFLTTAS